MSAISIIVPVYKVEPYLPRCINSILSQTFADFELILVDDGSPDRCGEICDEYAAKDSRIKVIHKENGGLSDARNVGVESAACDWIFFVDSDDLIHPQTVELLVYAQVSIGVDLVACGRISGERIPEGFFKRKDYSFRVQNIDDQILFEQFYNVNGFLSDVYWTAIPKLINKRIVRKYPFTKGKIYEDNGVCYKWLVEAKAIALIDEPLYFYTINPNGIMRRKFSTKKFDYLWALESQIRFYKEIGYKKMQSAVANEYFGSAVYLCKEAEKHLKDKKICRDLMRTTEKKYKEFSKFTEILLSDHTNNCILKYAHPVRFVLQKSVRKIRGRIEK